MKQHVGRYIESTRILDRHNVRRHLPSVHSELEALMARAKHLDHEAAERLLCTGFHHLMLRVEVTDPKWLEGLEVGQVFGSTAYDVWLDDPQRPGVEHSPQGAIVHAVDQLDFAGALKMEADPSFITAARRVAAVARPPRAVRQAQHGRQIGRTFETCSPTAPTPTFPEPTVLAEDAFRS